MTNELVGDAQGVAALADDYEILGEIGRGGSAVVFRARDRSLDRDVAIKVVHPRPTSPDDDAVARLAREARTVAQLQHPNIVTVFAVRRLPGGGLALVMQLIPGETLKHRIQRDGPLSPERCEHVLRDVAQALAYAHARGVVHRDVKPENIFLDEESGRAMLADFGIARSDEHDSVTLTGTAIGTPSYMSPEQVEGEAVDGRSDLYSLGLVAWEMLTGRRPWDGESLFNVIYKQKHDDLPPIEALRPGVPPRLQYIIERMLQKKPAARWAGAEGLLAQLSHSVLPGDYGKWQTAHRRRVERYREQLHERAKERAAAESTPGVSSSTVRFPRRPADASSTPDLPSTALADTMSVPVGGASRMAPPVPREAAPLVQSFEGAERPPVLEVVPVVHETIAPSWVTEPSHRRPRTRLVAAGVATILVASAAAAAVRYRASASVRAVSVPSSASATEAVPGAMPRARSVAPRAMEAATLAPPVRPASRAADSSIVATTGAQLIAAGGRHSCTVAFGSAVYCWGANERGQLGDGTDTRQPVPVRVIGDLSFVEVSAGASHTCALTRLGDVYCWGNDSRGQLGDATTVRRSAPVRGSGDGAYRQVRAGTAHTCAVTTDGRVRCWGGNDRGQLGIGSTRATTVPATVPMEPSAVAVAAGGTHSCALAVDGTAWCWGANGAGQLGDSTLADRLTPVRVAGGYRFASVSAGQAHSCAVSTRGEVLCWGRNDFGQLGNGSTASVAYPVPVRLPPGFQARSVVAASVHSCALGADGSAYCWGRNSFGQLGDGTLVSRMLPTRVQSSEPLAALDATSLHTCALTVGGQAVCWGQNGERQVGSEPAVRQGAPLAVPAFGGEAVPTTDVRPAIRRRATPARRRSAKR